MRGWGVAGALALAAVALSVVQPALLIAVPLGVVLVALPPRRLGPMLLGVLLLVAVLPLRGTDAVASLERGWVLLLGGWFVVWSTLGPERRVLVRALAAVAATFVTSVAVLLAADGVAGVDAAVQARLQSSAAAAQTAWSALAGEQSGRLSQAVEAAVGFQAAIYPALLCLGSLAALALASWAHGRLAAREPQPLGRFGEFRFPDALVWVLIAGVALLLLPVDELPDRAGSNLLAFMGALYALRGLAVLWVLGSPGPVGVVLAVLAAVFLYPLVLAATFVVGLSDTWLDIRTRREASDPNR